MRFVRHVVSYFSLQAASVINRHVDLEDGPLARKLDALVYSFKRE